MEFERPLLKRGLIQTLILISIIVVLFFIKLRNFLLFHTLVELFSVSVALGIFMIAWNSRKFARDNFLSFLGIAYLSVAGVDFLHTLTYKGMNIFSQHSTNASTQLWIIARAVEGIALVLAPFFVFRKTNLGIVAVIWYTLTAIPVLLVFNGLFPTCFIEGQGLTPFKIMNEYIICCLLLFAAYTMYDLRKVFNPHLLGLLIGTILVTMVSELSFTLYSDPYGYINMIGHFLKLISFYLVYRALIQFALREPYQFMFLQLQRSREAIKKSHEELEKRIEERTEALKESNRSLAEEIEKERHTQKSLEEEKEFTEAALNAQRDTFIVFDPSTGKPLRWNRMHALLSGFTDNEIASMKIFDDWCPEEEREMVRDAVLSIVAEGHGIFEMRVITKDGTTVPMEYSCSVIKNSLYSRGCIIAIGRNIAERLRARKVREEFDKNIRQSQKMESLGTLAGGIAHDFNNLLASILGYAELTQEETGRKNPNVSYYLDQILKGVHRARELVDQILTFSRQTEQKRRPVEVNLLVKEVVKFIRSSIPSTITIEYTGGEDNTTISADISQIYQVILNLCTNAFQAMEDTGGLLTVSVTVREVPAKSKLNLPMGNYVVIEVRDTGCGMDAVTKEKLFEPYFSTKETKKGTGLGLSVVHGITRNHGGTIAVESEEGQGACFQVYFPQIEKAVVIEPEGVPRFLPHGNESLLLVDDDVMYGDMMSTMLRSLGYKVEYCSSSIRALNSFVEQPGQYDCVITDLSMPNLTGLQLSKAVHKIKPHIPIILCTGFFESVREKNTRKLGIQEVVLKPVIKQEMAEAIRKVIDRKRRIKPQEAFIISSHEAEKVAK